MVDTPRLEITQLAQNQAIPEVAVNLAFMILEAGGAGGFPILDRDLTAPPGGEAEGDCYVVAASATGAWAGQDGKIALFAGGGWHFVTVKVGFLLYVVDEGAHLVWDGSAYQAFAGGIVAANTSETRAGTSGAKAVTPAGLFGAAEPVDLSISGGSAAVDMAAGVNFNLILDQNTTIANPTNEKSGQSGRFLISQDGTGGWSLGFGANWNRVGEAPTLPTAPLSECLFGYVVNADDDIDYWYIGAKA